MHRVLLQRRQRRLVLLLQLPLLLHLDTIAVLNLGLNNLEIFLHLFTFCCPYLLLQLLVELLQLLELGQLLRVLLQRRLQLRLLRALAVNLARGLGLRALAGRDVRQAASWGWKYF